MSGKHFPGLSRYLILTIVLASLLVLLIPVSVVMADDVVTFPDPNLQAAIRQALGQPTGNIYQSDLDGLTSLHASHRGIVDLTGLEHCTNLTELDLGGNQISSISALSGLIGLYELFLEQNQISDISPLSGLNGLLRLSLEVNQVSNLSPLSGLTNLGYLHLQGNQIGNLSPLSGLTNLYDLYLGVNQVSDIASLSGLTSLWRLYLDGNQITDISALSGLTSLGILNLEGNQIPDIQPLVNNPGLSTGDWVDLAGNPLSSTSVNDYIPQLRARGVDVLWSALPASNTPVGSPVTVTLNGVAITFDIVTVAGNTSVTAQASPCGSLPSGFIVRGPSLHLTTTATYSGSVTVAITYNDSGIPTDGDLRLFHCDGTSWQDVTTSVDTVHNIIYGQDSVLSWWQIGDPMESGGGGGGGGVRSAPVFPSIYVGIGAALVAGIVACLLRRRLAAHD